MQEGKRRWRRRKVEENVKEVERQESVKEEEETATPFQPPPPPEIRLSLSSEAAGSRRSPVRRCERKCLHPGDAAN